MMVGCLAMLGRIGEARIVARDLLEIDPSFRVSKLAEWYPLVPDDLARLVRGMKAAGLPE
jgi:adenylate cyclase